MSKKKKVVDARFRDRESSRPPASQPSVPPPSSPSTPSAAKTRPQREASSAGQPRYDRRRSSQPQRPVETGPVDEEETESSEPSSAPSWASPNILVPILLVLGLGAVGWWIVQDRREQAELHRDGGLYAPDAGTARDGAVGGDASAPAPTPAPSGDAGAASDGGATDAVAVALNGDPVEPRTAEPSSPDPRHGRFSLEDATRGLAGAGNNLVADIDTSMGRFSCELLSGEAPNTVANFVGLARGVRDFWDPVSAAWVRRPFYDGSVFHRVIPGFMIQGGDVLRSGYGGTGYEFGDENVNGHNAAGQLCMANHGPGTNGGQFFITEAPRTHLDGTYSIFGRCTPTELVGRIARVETEGERPRVPVFIRTVRVRRAG